MSSSVSGRGSSLGFMIPGGRSGGVLWTATFSISPAVTMSPLPLCGLLTRRPSLSHRATLQLWAGLWCGDAWGHSVSGQHWSGSARSCRLGCRFWRRGLDWRCGLDWRRGLDRRRGLPNRRCALEQHVLVAGVCVPVVVLWGGDWFGFVRFRIMGCVQAGGGIQRGLMLAAAA